jgi:hypothetical protein
MQRCAFGWKVRQETQVSQSNLKPRPFRPGFLLPKVNFTPQGPVLAPRVNQPQIDGF